MTTNSEIYSARKKINTLNESSLHSTLKKIYSLDEKSRTEVELDGKIYDIVSEDGNIIEIQTQNLGKLLAKCMIALEKKRSVKIVFPLVITKHLELYDERGSLISRRKSPKKCSIYDLFNELTGIYPVVLEEKFCLEVLECSVCERRIKTDAPVQTPNGRRRFKKDWIKSDKCLEEIIKKHVFSTAQDYLMLLPNTLPKEFTVNDIRTALKADKTLPASAAKNANLIVWVLSRMQLIDHIGKKGRSRLYTIHI